MVHFARHIEFFGSLTTGFIENHRGLLLLNASYLATLPCAKYMVFYVPEIMLSLTNTDKWVW